MRIGIVSSTGTLALPTVPANRCTREYLKAPTRHANSATTFIADKGRHDEPRLPFPEPPVRPSESRE
jgi:hypothetical protein